MNELLGMRFLRLLSESSQEVTNKKCKMLMANLSNK